MDVREKLVELLQDGDNPVWGWFPNNATMIQLADYLIAHGVTVQDGKPLDAFLHPVDAYKGLKAKYLVFKADTGERVGNCFVLRPDKDPAAVEAIKAYARATDNETLAEDIYNWVGKGEPVQEWISVDDRLPEDSNDGFADAVLVTDGFVQHMAYFVGGEWRFAESGEIKEPMWYRITHWMPLPQPSEGD